MLADRICLAQHLYNTSRLALHFESLHIHRCREEPGRQFDLPTMTRAGKGSGHTEACMLEEVGTEREPRKAGCLLSCGHPRSTLTNSNKVMLTGTNHMYVSI